MLQIYVDGDRSQPSLVGIVVPDTDQVLALGKSLGLSGGLNELVRNPKLKEAIFEDLMRVSKEDGLAFFEQVAVSFSIASVWRLSSFS